MFTLGHDLTNIWEPVHYKNQFDLHCNINYERLHNYTEHIFTIPKFLSWENGLIMET